MSAPGLLTLIGSGEASAGMVKVHRSLLERLGEATARPVFLETPAGFELGVEAIAARFQEYFHSSLGIDLRRARYHARSDSPALQAEALASLAESNYIVAGPGSPTYAVEHLRNTPILATLLARWRAGAQLVFASAATISLGRHALPVYEIYKVGRPLDWAAGLDLLGPFGFELAIVPHWDNAEGGTHDTRACFMGMERFAQLRALLPSTATVLAIDEHTAVTLDFDRSQAGVAGRGHVTILRREGEATFGHGDAFPLKDLQTETTAARPPAAPASLRSESPLAALGKAAAQLGAGDLSGGLRTAADGAPDDLAALLYQAASAADGSRAPDDEVGPLLEILIDLRSALRERSEWALADGLRARLMAIGFQLRDTPHGTVWMRGGEAAEPTSGAVSSGREGP